MKQNVSGLTLEGARKDSSVAWFKLAELVSRGEKEKALNLYRLLSHSFEERAYTLQIEGDILWAFEDESAIDRYQQAAFLYQKEQKIVSALAIYEHLLTLQPNNYEYVGNLVACYARLGWEDKFDEKIFYLLDLVEKQKIFKDQAWDVIEGLVGVIEEIGDGCGLFDRLVGILRNSFSDLADRAEALLRI